MRHFGWVAFVLAWAFIFTLAVYNAAPGSIAWRWQHPVTYYGSDCGDPVKAAQDPQPGVVDIPEDCHITAAWVNTWFNARRVYADSRVKALTLDDGYETVHNHGKWNGYRVPYMWVHLCQDYAPMAEVNGVWEITDKCLDSQANVGKEVKPSPRCTPEHRNDMVYIDPCVLHSNDTGRPK